MAPRGQTSLDAGNGRLEDDQDVKQRLLKQGAEVIDQQSKKQIELGELTRGAISHNLDPAQNPDCIRLQAELVKLQTQYDALEATWAADFPGAKRMFSLRLNGGQYKNYLDDQVQDSERRNAPATTARAEVLATTHVAVMDFQKEMESYADGKDQNHIALTAQALVEAKLMPSDLVDKPYSAIGVVFGSNPALARSLIGAMNGPDSPQRAEVAASLNKIRDALTDAYQTLRNNKEMVKNIEQGTIQGTLAYKLKTVAGEIGRDPLALTAFVTGLVGLGYVFWTSEAGTKKSIGKWLGGGAAVVGGVYLGDFIWGKMDAQHRGLFDRIGMDPGNLMAPELVSNVKAQLAGYPQADQDSIMDMARIFDMKMPDVNDAFEKALSSGSHKIDPLTLQARGVKIADGGSLFNALGYFYGTECYNEAVKDPTVAISSNPDEQMKIGLHYAQRHLTGDKLSTAVYALGPDHQAIQTANGLQAAAGVSGAPAATVAEGIKDAPMEQLASKHPALKAAFAYGKDNTILIKGYPYTHRFVDGKDIFTPVLKAADGSPLPETPFKGSDSDSLFEQFVTNSETAARKEIQTKLDADLTYSGPYKTAHSDGGLSYNNDGTWVLNPGLAMESHAGLPTLGNGTVPLFYKFEKGHLALHMTSSLSKPEYADLKTAREDYEKATPIHDEVATKVAYDLLGVPFIVKTVVDNAATKETTVTIEYAKDHHTGTVTYKDGALESINLKADANKDLKDLWTAKATKNVQDLMKTPMVTAELTKMAEGFRQKHPDTWTGEITDFVGNLKAYLKDSFDDLTKEPSDLRFKNDFVVHVKDLQVQARDALVNNLYSADKLPVDFDASKRKFDKDFPDALRGLVDTDLGNPTDTVATAALTNITTFDANLGTHMAGTEMNLSAAEIRTELPSYNKKLEDAWNKALDLHFYSIDSARRAVLQTKITEQVSAMDNDILALSPATKGKVKTITDKYERKALTASGTYYGMDTRTAVDQMFMDRLDTPAKKALWEGPTKVVEAYVMYKLKWENYAILTKPENANAIMNLWFDKIDQGNKSQFILNGVSTPYSQEYADYFISNLDIFLGKQKDYSPDRLYGDVYTVSDTKFNEAITGITRDMDDPATWISKGKTKLPVPDALKPVDEVYRDQARANFEQWFSDNADPGALLKLDGEWPQQFETGIDAQFQNVLIDNSTASAAVLDQKIDLFRQETLLLRYGVFEQYITNKIEDNKLIKFQDHDLLFEDMHVYVQNNNLTGYQTVVKDFIHKHYLKDWAGINLGVPFY